LQSLQQMVLHLPRLRVPANIQSAGRVSTQSRAFC
jgi:hypothetical protein